MNDLKLKQKRLALLEETINHYNLNNRCISNSGCFYSPKKAGLEGKTEGCAIGRKVGKKLAIKLDGVYVKQSKNSTIGIEGGSSVTNPKIFALLPKKLTSLGQSFLNLIQDLHDTSQSWDNKGITSAGMRKVSVIKQTFNLNLND